MAKTASIQLRVEPEPKERLMAAAAAAAANRSITNYIETLLRNETERNDKED